MQWRRNFIDYMQPHSPESFEGRLGGGRRAPTCRNLYEKIPQPFDHYAGEILAASCDRLESRGAAAHQGGPSRCWENRNGA
ncbi:MAG: hypothetical protein ACYCU0_00265 [Solirubrobacteraceae bacterium]